MGSKAGIDHFRRMFYTQIMSDHKVQVLRTVVIVQNVVSVIAILYLLDDLISGSTKVGANIGGPILLFIVFIQLMVSIVVLARSYARPKNTKG
jgi:uncharacterized membrane protein YhhN